VLASFKRRRKVRFIKVLGPIQRGQYLCSMMHDSYSDVD
jgi:hypothetical protein